MTSISYNNSDCTYLAVQALNSNQVDSNSIICNISQKTNPIVNDLSNYDVFLTSFTCNSSDLPYFNILRNISWDVDNFETNKTNMSITIMIYTSYYHYTNHFSSIKYHHYIDIFTIIIN